MASPSRTLRFGLSRSNGGPNLQLGAQQFADVLSARAGANVKVSVAYDYEQLLKHVVGRSIEVAWLPPLIHVRAVAGGAKLVALSERGGSLFYRSALLVRGDSPIQTLGDLKGVRAAWVDKSSSSGYLFPRMHLRAAGIAVERAFVSEKFYGSAAAAARAVANDEADVCACFLSKAHDRAQAQVEVSQTFGPIAARLRVLDVTEPIPPDGFVLGAHLEREERADLAQELLGLHHDAAGHLALKTLLQAERLMPPTEAVLRQLSRLEQQIR